ncbi:MAG: alpha/beta hydrolase [Mycobacteriales bacterium]
MIVFVHGVPETAAIWNKIRALIGQESDALALPGFGCPLPGGFGGTKDDYADWLVHKLEAYDEPVDLVGHDWGAGLTYRVVTTRPELVRSWAADIGNIAHPDYEWHDIGKLWQTPGEGEAFVEAQNAMSPQDRAGLFEAMGVSHEDALEMAAASDATMGTSILGLYRSALPNPHADWGPWSPLATPGLVLNPSDDVFGDERLAREVADQLGAQFAVIEGSGHFWPYQAPAAGAALLTAFWDALPASRT